MSSVTSLARVEGRHLLRHPVVLAGVGFVILGGVMFIRTATRESSIRWDDDAWTVSAGFLLLAVLTLVACNFATLRDGREDTVDQHASLPVGRTAKTMGLLAATLWPVAMAVPPLAAVAIYGATQTTLTATDRAHLVAVIVSIAMFGALGIALATWIPNPFVAPVSGWALLIVTPADIAPSWQVLAPIAGLHDTSLAIWHIGYQIGLTIMFGSIAVARTHRGRGVVVAAMIGLAVVGISAAVMVTRVCPSARCTF